MFRVKICGITNLRDAVTAIEAGADALGFNFYPKSPRCISLEAMQQLSAELARRRFALINKVGVFVNHPDPLQVAIAGGLDTIQLHGDETPQQLVELVQAAAPQGIQVWRAFRCREPDLTDVADYLYACNSIGGLPEAVLLDAFAPGAFGGTGKVLDWNTVRTHGKKLHRRPVILAGGLNPENVAEAIRTAQPDAVDVASGVEGEPGKKDAAKVRKFIQAAISALNELKCG